MLAEIFHWIFLATNPLSSIRVNKGTKYIEPRQIPANAPDVITIKSFTGVTIRYKEPGKAGVGSYAGTRKSELLVPERFRTHSLLTRCRLCRPRSRFAHLG